MPSTNHTGYLNLTQYLGTDVTSWLEDYNSDMRKIDQGVQNNHTEIANAMTDIGSNTNNIATNTGAITNLTQDVSGVTTEVGTLKNQVTNQSGQLANLTTQMGTANTNISNLQSSYTEINEQVSENASNITNIQNGNLTLTKITDFEYQLVQDVFQYIFSLQKGLYYIESSILSSSPRKANRLPLNCRNIITNTFGSVTMISNNSWCTISSTTDNYEYYFYHIFQVNDGGSNNIKVTPVAYVIDAVGAIGLNSFLGWGTISDDSPKRNSGTLYKITI